MPYSAVALASFEARNQMVTIVKAWMPTATSTAPGTRPRHIATRCGSSREIASQIAPGRAVDARAVSTASAWLDECSHAVTDIDAKSANAVPEKVSDNTHERGGGGAGMPQTAAWTSTSALPPRYPVQSSSHVPTTRTHQRFGCAARARGWKSTRSTA